MSTPQENPSPANTAPSIPRIDFDLACVRCEASLNGAPLDGACPACRKPVADTLDPDIINLRTATVSANIRCPKCGYNLRTLGIGNVCPECGQAVSPVLYRPPLKMTDPAWRKRVLSGIHRLLFVLIPSPVIIFVAGLPMPTGSRMSELLVLLALLAIESCLLVAVITGIFLASEQDRQASAPPNSAIPRIVARTTIILAAFLLLWTHAETWLGTAFLPSALQYLADEWATLLLIVFCCISLIALGFCFRQIARRARERSLIKGTNVWLILFTVATILAASGIIASHVAPSLGLGFPGMARLQDAAAFLCMFAIFTLYVLALFAFLAYRLLLRRAEPAANKRRRPKQSPHPHDN